MKALLIIIATLSLFNENSNAYEKFEHMFTRTAVTFDNMSKTYYFDYIHLAAEMDVNTFDDFKNGSSKLVLEFPLGLNIDTTRMNDFFIEVDTTRYYFDDELGYLTDLFFTIPNFVQFDYTATTSLYISIPSADMSPVSNYANAFLVSNLFTKEGFKDYYFTSDYNDGYYDGYDDGLFDGQDEGYGYGFDDGYADGYDDGLYIGTNTNDEMSGLFIILGQGFSSIASILAIQLFPGFTLGTLLFLPLLFGIAFVLFKFLLGGSS